MQRSEVFRIIICSQFDRQTCLPHEHGHQDFALDPGGVSVLEDGSMVVAGGALKDPDSELYFTACKLDADGTIIWKWQVNHDKCTTPNAPSLGCGLEG